MNGLERIASPSERRPFWRGEANGSTTATVPMVLLDCDSSYIYVLDYMDISL